jgi:23S rRNA pseudouridine1911/1915/1917 synthase
MKDIGHPVAGDQKYGDGRNPLGRLALHAFRLDFYHPRTGQPMSFETPIPRLFLQKVQTRQQESETPQLEET